MHRRRLLNSINVSGRFNWRNLPSVIDFMFDVLFTVSAVFLLPVITFARKLVFKRVVLGASRVQSGIEYLQPYRSGRGDYVTRLVVGNSAFGWLLVLPR